MRIIRLGKREISEKSRPYIIAEIGVNHEGSLETAKRLIAEAKDGGADGAKFQTYKAETLASKHSPAYWDTTKESTLSQFELFKKYDSFGKVEYEALADYCQQLGIDFLSTPFDLDAVDFLAPHVPFFKIASADITALPLLRRVAATGKPVILSTGCSTLAEIDFAVHELTGRGCREIALLHCILNYPTKEENANLGMIESLRRTYPHLVIGYSDHTPPDAEMFVPTAAVAMGARIIEKHFTYDKTLPGNDHYHAMDVADLRKLNANLDRFFHLRGASLKGPLASEESSRRNARRSIVLKVKVFAGTKLTEDMITFKRPAHGVSPLHWDEIVGRTTRVDLEEDRVLQWSDLV